MATAVVATTTGRRRTPSCVAPSKNLGAGTQDDGYEMQAEFMDGSRGEVLASDVGAPVDQDIPGPTA